MPDFSSPTARILPAVFLSGPALAELGLSRHRVTCLVAEGRLLRLRKGQYVRADLREELVRVGTLGGRLDCVSLLNALGVFVRGEHGLHMQLTPGTTRLPERPADVVAHWRTTARPRNALAASVVEALAQACRCQSPRDAVATLDSAWHLGLVDAEGIAGVFTRLPQRLQFLQRLLDPRSESGPESIMRLLLRNLGAHVVTQVDIAGVGRVDFVVDGWLIVECDSRAHHEGWKSQKRDRARDLESAALGYTTIRPLAEDIMYRHDDLIGLVKRVIAQGDRRAGLQNSTGSRR